MGGRGCGHCPALSQLALGCLLAGLSILHNMLFQGAWAGCDGGGPAGSRLRLQALMGAHPALPLSGVLGHVGRHQNNLCSDGSIRAVSLRMFSLFWGGRSGALEPAETIACHVSCQCRAGIWSMYNFRIRFCRFSGVASSPPPSQHASGG